MLYSLHNTSHRHVSGLNQWHLLVRSFDLEGPNVCWVETVCNFCRIMSIINVGPKPYFTKGAILVSYCSSLNHIFHTYQWLGFFSQNMIVLYSYILQSELSFLSVILQRSYSLTYKNHWYLNNKFHLFQIGCMYVLFCFVFNQKLNTHYQIPSFTVLYILIIASSIVISWSLKH